MSTTELQEQRKIPVGGADAPTYIGEFHQRYGDEPQLFHSYCREHSDFGTCGGYADALADAQNHLALEHGETVLELQLAKLRRELSYRLETVAAYAHTRGRFGEQIDPKFIEEQLGHALSYLAAQDPQDAL